MDPIVIVSTSGVSSLLAYAGQLFNDFQPLIYLAIGIPLGFYIIGRGISLVGRKTRK